MRRSERIVLSGDGSCERTHASEFYRKKEKKPRPQENWRFFAARRLERRWKGKWRFTQPNHLSL
jgi:hypothetical protein